jgi:hypothetical protein
MFAAHIEKIGAIEPNCVDHISHLSRCGQALLNIPDDELRFSVDPVYQHNARHAISLSPGLLGFEFETGGVSHNHLN